MKFLIASITGAIIGYITNWLAIKMLFRPYTEKRIFGIKVPFTPGLIPKERGRIAKSVGETVGEHLITKDDVMNALCSPKMNEHLEVWVQKKVLEIGDSSASIKDNIKPFLGDDYETVMDSINNHVKNIMLASLSKDSIKEKLGEAIEKVVKGEFQVSPEKLLENEKLMELKDNLINKIKEYKASPHFNEKVEAYVIHKVKELENSEMAIEDVVPASLMTSMKQYIHSSRNEICETINEMLKEPEVEAKLKKAVGDMLSTNMSPLVSMFINVDTIYGKVRNAIEDYLKEDENQKNVAQIVNKTIDNIAKGSVKDFIGKLEQLEENDSLKDIAKFISTNILADNIIDDTANELEEYIKRHNSLHELMVNIDSNYIGKVSEFILLKLQVVIESESFKSMLKSMIQSGTTDILNVPLGDLVKSNEKKVTKAALKIVQDIYQRFIDNEAINIVGTFNIPKIVEEKINNFDVTFAEKIILDIASKELSAITWLGALLGAIIGILSPILG
jgi:uncharacterized membrane protein YheB (UPF0754 family)